MLCQARCAIFIKDLAEHQFFASCSFTNARYTLISCSKDVAYRAGGRTYQCKERAPEST